MDNSGSHHTKVYKLLINKDIDVTNSRKHSKTYAERGQTEPGLVAFYNIKPGNGAGLFFQSDGARTGLLCARRR